MFPRQKANNHVSVTFLLSHFRSSLFPLRFRFFFSFFNPFPRSHDHFSEILPLRNIKVNNGKFYLFLRSSCFVNGCVFTRVYVIWKICEKLGRIHSCWCLLDLSEIQDKKEWVLVRREVLVSGLFYPLTLTGDVLFGVHFENNCNGCFKCTCASFLRLLELGVCLVLLYDSTTSLQWSIGSLVKRLFYFSDEDKIEQKPRDAQA